MRFPVASGWRLKAHSGRLCTTAFIPINEESCRLCLRVMRTTFAVRGMTSRTARQEDLNRLLPALAAYTGNAGLESAQ